MITKTREKFIDSPGSEYLTSVNLNKKTYTIVNCYGNIEVPAKLGFHRLSTESVETLYKALEDVFMDLRHPVKLVIQDIK